VPTPRRTYCRLQVDGGGGRELGGRSRLLKAADLARLSRGEAEVKKRRWNSMVQVNAVTYMMLKVFEDLFRRKF